MSKRASTLINVVYSPHRAETLAQAATYLQVCDAVVLEEPATPFFSEMLRGRRSIGAYLEATDFEFPEFERRTCELLQRIHREGKKIYQIDPFLELLDGIHRFFEKGGKPQALDPESEMGRVYATERRWSAALLANYEQCPLTAFDGVVSMVQQFAREDAARNRLRDRMRAKGIAALANEHRNVYVEAGGLHLFLLRELRENLPASCRIRPIYLMAPVLRRLIGKRNIFSPGERLTLHYTFRPDFRGTQADLLAARSLVHAAIVEKRELDPETAEYPHLKNEIETNALVERLGFDEAKHLYGRIMGRTTREAMSIARRFVAVS